MTTESNQKTEGNVEEPNAVKATMTWTEKLALRQKEKKDGKKNKGEKEVSAEKAQVTEKVKDAKDEITFKPTDAVSTEKVAKEKSKPVKVKKQKTVKVKKEKPIKVAKVKKEKPVKIKKEKITKVKKEKPIKVKKVKVKKVKPVKENKKKPLKRVPLKKVASYTLVKIDKKRKKEKNTKEENTKNYPKFRYWLMDNKITQKDLAQRTHLSVNTLYRLTHLGTATKSIIKLIAMELDITEEKLMGMLKP